MASWGQQFFNKNLNQDRMVTLQDLPIRLLKVYVSPLRGNRGKNICEKKKKRKKREINLSVWLLRQSRRDVVSGKVSQMSQCFTGWFFRPAALWLTCYFFSVRQKWQRECFTGSLHPANMGRKLSWVSCQLQAMIWADKWSKLPLLYM